MRKDIDKQPEEGLLRTFFNRRLFLNCIVFSVPVSLLMLMRITHINNIPFFSADAAQIYLFLVFCGFFIFLFILFVLHWLSKRPQED
jgi:hypothetical protein